MILLAPALAEVSECTGNSSCPANLALRNLTIVAGFQGSTVLYCSSNADCVDTGYFKCFNDIDGVSNGSSTGWCNATSITSCYVNGTAYNTSYYYCTTSTTYQQCSSGAWGSSTSCSGNATCTSGTASPCAAGGSGGSGGGGSGSNATPTPTPAAKTSISITSAISDFDLVQSESTVKSLTAKNNGNKSLSDVKLTISGTGTGVDYSISPDKFSNISVGSTATFVINFSAGVNATIKSYSITTEVASSDAKASATFTLRILPSNATVASTILPLYDSLKRTVAALEQNITELEKQGINTTAVKRLLADIKDKLNTTMGAIEKKDYFTAAQLLDSAKALIANLQSAISASKAPGADFVLIAIIVIVVVAIAILVYLMWPAGEGFSPKKGWQSEKEKSITDKILEKIRKKKASYGSS